MSTDRLTFTRAPIPFDPKAGEEAERTFADLDPQAREVLSGAAGCSPHLRGLMGSEADWLRTALEAPEAARDALVTSPADVMSPKEASDVLRRDKRRISLLTGIADLGGAWSLEEVTGALTAFADRSVQDALAATLAGDLARGKLPGQGEEELPTLAGMVVIAMGKMGAAELNYSSDIDLVCLFDQSLFEPKDYAAARAVYVKAVRNGMALLSDRTRGGYVWRTDLRLRPDASVTPVCLSIEAAERYYESVGRTWERAAHIKARPCAGAIEAGETYLSHLRPFVWRRHLDFAAIRDAHDMRVAIRDHRGLHDAEGLDGRDLKLGPGGIREIEFFTQTRQLIAGGRDSTLRSRKTLPALAALASAGWIEDKDAADLTDHYRRLRELEHRVQMVEDTRTHCLPTSAPDWDRIARMCGEGDTSRFRGGLTALLADVATRTDPFFAPGLTGDALPGPADAGQEEPELIARWRTYPAMRSSRATEIFERLKPDLLGRLGRAADPGEALRAFDGFLRGLPAGVQIFSLFEANPQLRELIVDIAATAPALAEYLSRNSAVFDAVLGGTFFEPWPEQDSLRRDLSDLLAASSDHEDRLNAARRWMKERHFRIGVHHLRGLIDAEEAGRLYASLADAILGALFPVVVDEFAQRHGSPPGRGVTVLAMGALGAGWLTARSDLDLIVIYDADGGEMSDGRRPLPARTYYARLTQALITSLTAPTTEGRLYEADMRLRPSGRQGPVATSLQAFETYQQSEAWTWEHLALTRARPVASAGEAGVAEGVAAVRDRLLGEPRPKADVLAELAKLRVRIGEAKSQRSALDVKPGPGGLQDIELAAQAAALICPGAGPRDAEGQLTSAEACGAPFEIPPLRDALRLQRRVQSAIRLVSGEPPEPGTLAAGPAELLLRGTGHKSLDALEAALADARTRAAAAIDAALEGYDDA
ncbi:bifunctional [glutamine synthetase] adenylyltransferase/[glutamine synthetase]-adenylyl-L-tyrosine phosphorylase [Roseicyclus sp. F158]|uniref:Bifunctional [glutamine synthetase] adenylyltransferase/[glutamine synthetase]-adenylyl-L-tyrosine phosphorylase n=1 Tax=Tropicimonas omnivorans TaxID=3075590 RepID=A0ABU3DJ58_9RHOB|nr:bifunctional [glutamine synthetase] adenylyltransferase/[glutamine synthetase]-adenylyl-L-tyrosine phosphorylase [Roseicyclus sp. F158]MDT0683754.1 bifunctional [glutamine synthetase] adenylyltransferase/[glutamine synthetase]-adenylyl-L-tyrosine phosphorylase [Roseicyclus sp. F158]